MRTRLADWFKVAAVSVLTATAAHGQVVGLGVLGDSLSDEYFEESYGSYARNWTVMLRQFRSVNLGPTAAEAAQAGGTWGEPRRRFYQLNWARSGANSSTLLTQGQHIGVAADVAAGRTSHVVLAIGTNDYSPLGSAYSALYNNTWTAQQSQNYANTVANNIRTAANSVLAAGDARLVLCNVIDYSVSPLTRLFFPNGANRDRVAAGISLVNVQLKQFARERGLIYVDTFALTKAIFGPNTALRSTILIGNVPIQLGQSTTSTNGNPRAAFVDDNVHPNTPLQGVFCNTLTTAINAYLPASEDIGLFTEAQILQISSLTYGGQDTLLAQLGGGYDRFIYNFYCPADTTLDNTIDVADFFEYLARFSANDPRADLDLSGTIDVSDFFEFLSGYSAGCP